MERSLRRDRWRHQRAIWELRPINSYQNTALLQGSLLAKPGLRSIPFQEQAFTKTTFVVFFLSLFPSSRQFLPWHLDSDLQAYDQLMTGNNLILEAAAVLLTVSPDSNFASNFLTADPDSDCPCLGFTGGPFHVAVLNLFEGFFENVWTLWTHPLKESVHLYTNTQRFAYNFKRFRIPQKPPSMGFCW